MLMSEWKLEEALEVEREEGWEAGLERGREEGLEEGLGRGRQEGLELGLGRGLERGRQEGLELGLGRGRQEGRQEGRGEAIKNLLMFGMSPDQVSQALKLPLDTVMRHLDRANLD
jgi:predicted transposase YdaD